MFFRRFFSSSPETKVAREMYSAIVAKARQPYFYAELHVPDTIDGRFDMIALHAILLMNRLAQGGPHAKALSQRLFDEFFADMDRSLREMGVGDLSIGKKVRNMAEVFYGRAKAYRDALERGDHEALERALARNIYIGEAAAGDSQRLARYVTEAWRSLAAQAEAEIVAGRPHFPDPENRRSKL
jgi:cytochrome b pre-mRNA-processing protein 3